MSLYGFGTIKEYEKRDCGKYEEELAKALDFYPEDLSLTIMRLDGLPAMTITLYHSPTGREIAYGSLVMMPGCCGLVVSTGSYVNMEYRDKGVGGIMHKIRQDISSEAGFSCMICTDVTSNTPQQNILKKNGWKLAHEFHNRNSGNNVGVHIIDLEE